MELSGQLSNLCGPLSRLIAHAESGAFVRFTDKSPQTKADSFEPPRGSDDFRRLSSANWWADTRLGRYSGSLRRRTESIAGRPSPSSSGTVQASAVDSLRHRSSWP